MKVLVAGSAGQIAYSMLPRLAKGDVWGPDRKVHLKMLDLPQTENIMHGVRMELEDCAFSTLESIKVFTTDHAEKAFSDVDCIVMLANAMELKANMPRAKLLEANLKLYRDIASYFSKNDKVKILMIANPANTNCTILIDALKSKVPTKNFSCLTRLDHNRSKAMVAIKLGISTSDVRKMLVWGNHSHTMVPDLRFCEVNIKGKWVPALSVLDKTWVTETFIPTVRNRVWAIIEARGKSSSLSASSAGIDHLRDWLIGTPAGDWVSMGVHSEGEYACVPSGLVFGHPCTCEGGEYRIVKGLEIDENTKKMIEITAKELKDEKDSVLK